MDITETTLEDLDRHRRQYASELRLSEYTLLLLKIEESSVLVTWLVPTDIVPHLKCHGEEDGVSMEEILELSIDGECIYSRALCTSPKTQFTVPQDVSQHVLTPSEDIKSTGEVESIVSTEVEPPKWSPGYETLKRCFPDLVIFLRESADTIADHMFSKNILALDVRHNVADKSKQEKIREILLSVISQTKVEPASYQTFVQVLREQGEWVEPMVQKLEECYQTQSAAANVEEFSTETEDGDKAVRQESFRLRMGVSQESKVTWGDNDDTKTVGVTGERHVLFIVSKCHPTGPDSDIVPRRTRDHALTEEEKRKLEEQGVPEDCHYSDLSVMMARYLLDKRTTVVGILAGEKATCKNIKEQVKELMSQTSKAGVVLHYIGPGQKDTGDWCFSDGFISFREIMDLYTKHFKERILTIVSDCSYSGDWVTEAMKFLDEQGVGPCGHAAKVKGILVKAYASCQQSEVPAKLAFSTHCVSNNKYTGELIYTGHLLTTFYEVYDKQHPSGLDYTSLRCGKKIEEECQMAPGSTWKKWSTGERIYAVLTEDFSDKPVWCYVQVEGNKINKVRIPRSMIDGVLKASIDYSDSQL